MWGIEWCDSYISGEEPYNPACEIQDRIQNGPQPIVEEGSTSRVCIEDETPDYTGEGDFQPILVPTFDENGNQTGFKVPESEDPDNLCPTESELNNAYE
jgi:hypothetical protein